MKKVCPKCLDSKEVTMKRISVSKAIAENRVGSLFSNRRMYLPYYCPKCDYKGKFITYRYRLEGSWTCMKCKTSQKPEELRKKVEGNIIEVDYRCQKCGNKWTTVIEYYPI